MVKNTWENLCEDKPFSFLYYEDGVTHGVKFPMEDVR